MANQTELELKTFELSNGLSGSSLSVTSLAMISGLPSQHSSEELCQLIQSKKLWLMSPGVCRIQIIVDRQQLSMLLDNTEAYFAFLEHLADAICQCSLWASLGLTIKQEDIQYEPPYEGAPNLYFIIEHPQKSSMLLSPPQSPTARFNGIECLFRYQSGDPEVSSTATELPDTQDTIIGDHSPMTALHALESISDTYGDVMPLTYWGEPFANMPANQALHPWDDATHLAEMALHVTIGIKKRIRGLRLFHLDTKPSLLELAPTIWNAHYLKAVTSHVTKFPLISNILASSTRSRSSSLRQKSKKLLFDDASSHQPTIETGTETDLNIIYRSSIERRLWNLVQTSLDPTTRTKSAGRNTDPQLDEVSDEPYVLVPLEVDHFDAFEYGISDNTLGSIGFSGMPSERFPPYLMSTYQPPDNGNGYNTVSGHPRRWCEDEDVECTDEDLPPEITGEAEEIRNSPHSNHESSFYNQSSSSRDSRSIPASQGHIFNGSGNLTVDEDLDMPDYFDDMENIHDTIEEPSFEQQIVAKEETLRESGYSSDVNGPIEEEYYLKEEQVDSQDIEMYKQY